VQLYEGVGDVLEEERRVRTLQTPPTTKTALLLRKVSNRIQKTRVSLAKHLKHGVKNKDSFF
jgi:hypothetical protein